LRHGVISLYSYKIVDKVILSTVSNTGIYYSGDKFGTHEAECIPFQTHYFSGNVVEPEIEIWPVDL
jgi:hypothetical protein